MKPLAQSQVNHSVTDTLIQTENGSIISARVFAVEQPSSVVVMAGAMGVAQQCYEKFALFLNEQGHTVVTFDYCGTGLSLKGHIKHCKTDILGWGEQDCNAVIEYVKIHFPGTKIQWVGHSVGSQLMGMTREFNSVSRAISIAAGSGYWRENSAPTKKMVWLLWYFIAPMSVGLLGYFPGKRLNMVGDLPGNVMSQWRRWCKNNHYAVGYEGEGLRQQYASVTVPITAISFEDDEMMSLENTLSLNGFFEGSPLTHTRLSLADTQGESVGHLGWFREKFRESIWERQLLPILNDDV